MRNHDFAIIILFLLILNEFEGHIWTPTTCGRVFSDLCAICDVFGTFTFIFTTLQVDLLIQFHIEQEDCSQC